MKYFFLLPACMALASCAWLENVDLPARQALVLPDTQVQRLTAEALGLRARAEDVRIRLAAETDRRIRTRQYRELRNIDNARLPLERQLEDAGHPLPSAVTGPSGT